jgi:hypothetical protein
MEQRPGTVRLAFIVMGGVVIALLFIGCLSAWRNPEVDLATKAMDTLGLLGAAVVGYFFGKAS